MDVAPKYINREISWLDFNARVLQEANDNNVPLIERLRFLGIFSNNLDEFFQVRYATVKRIAQSSKTGKKVFAGRSATVLLKEITAKVIKLQSESLEILNGIYQEMEAENIFFIDHNEVQKEQEAFLKNYFIQNVNPALVTIILSNTQNQDLTDNKAFLVVTMEIEEEGGPPIYALIEIPKNTKRFIVLPKKSDGKQYIMMLDDLIRYHFHMIFSFFNYKKIQAHMVKITRDAELDLEEDVSISYVEKITMSVKDRMISDPVRLVYDNEIPEETLRFVMDKLNIDSTDGLIPGGKYHQRRDYMDFPSLDRPDLLYSSIPKLPIPGLSLEENILDAIAKKDYLLYAPYQDFSYVIKFLREAALDPTVKSIKITIYRLSKASHIVSALINAAKNGKKVLVQIELQARFDEKNNINFAEKLEAAGVRLIFGIPGLKVHSKICIIERIQQNKNKRYGFVSTGNFNESTAKIYTDYTLFTANQKILKEVNKVFNFLEVSYKLKKYKHLIVSPHYSASILSKLIDQEIENKKNGLPSGISLKLNNITNYPLVDKLYEASQAGVKIKMMVRGICCLVPGVKGLSENITVLSVVDKFLEHPRVLIFENGGEKKIYLSSADFMTRNIENRVEVACPVYDTEIQKQILDTFDLSWNDNTKARVVNQHPQNKMVTPKKGAPMQRSQWTIYDYYKNKLIQ
ncbi:MAG: polyphosphate kinase 1 [Flavobacteriaceae bacterium]|jgi:polyphosphate kinase|nr:polyphosphate kinase 1 [Flavobacteriaceae bacterium]